MCQASLATESDSSYSQDSKMLTGLQQIQFAAAAAAAATAAAVKTENAWKQDNLGLGGGAGVQ